MKKKLLFLGVLFLSLALLASPISQANNYLESNNISLLELEDANTTRGWYGFEEQNILLKSYYTQESKGKYGVYLTAKELEIVDAREATREDAILLQERIIKSDLSEAFGGLYFDHLKDNGILRVAIVNDNEKSKEIINLVNEFKDKVNIETYEVEYSYDQLKQIQLQIHELFYKYEFRTGYVSISTPDNKLLVGVDLSLNNSKDSKEFVNSLNLLLSSDKYTLINESTVNKGFSRSDYTRPLIGGLKITSSSSCTGGFTGVTSTAEYVYVTAAHCSKGYPSYSQGGSEFGSVVARSFDLGAGPYPIFNADAASISTSSPYSGKIYDEDYSLYAIATSSSSYVVGYNVCKSGVSTGKTCGIIRSTSHNYALGYDPDSLPYGITDNFTATSLSDHGDSGAPAYNYVVHASGMGTQLLGLLSSGATVNQEFVTIYSKLPNIMDALDLTGVVVGD